jgi:glucose-1-phosphate thymidylyltransferase
MKGLILSGGKGTRLRPLTHTSAKQLVPVANKPVLFYGIEALVDAGIREIGIVVGDTHAEIEAAVGDGSRFGARIQYIPQDQPRGLAHAVLIAEEFLAGSRFVMYLGDNLLQRGITSLVAEYERLGVDCEILLTKVPNPSSFGVAELNLDGRVERLTEKPKEPRSDLALVGVYLFDSSIFEAARSIKPSARNELEITDAIQWLIDHDHSVHAHLVSGWWKDTGKAEDMLEANRTVLDAIEPGGSPIMDELSRVEGKVVFEGPPGSVILEDSVVRGPVIIGPGAHIKKSFVGPYTAVAAGCRFNGIEIENSIVWEGSTLEDVPLRISDSLIGRGVVIRRRPDRKPKAHRFLVGDSSEIGIGE